MFKPESLEHFADPLVRAYEDVVDALLVNIARHFNVTATGNTGTFEWQVQKLAELGQLTRENVAIIAKYTGADSGLLREALTQSMLAALHDVEPSLRQAAIAGFLTPAEHPPELSPGASQAVESYYRQAADKLNLVNTVMLQSSLAQYRKAVADTMAYEAHLNAAQGFLNTAAAEVITGASTHTQAVRRAVQRMASEGLTGFIDRGGHRWTPEAYVSMDVQTTMTNTAHAAVWARNEEYGNDLILVSTKAAARPKCYPWQNKVLSRTNAARDVQDLHGNTVHAYAMSETSYGQPDGLFGINCHHFSSPFIPGFSHLGGDPEPEDVNREQYAQSQKQRALEREVRHAKREAAMLDAAGDREAFEKAAMKVKQKQANLKAFAVETGRTLRSDRTQVLGYNRSVAGKVRAVKPVAPKGTRSLSPTGEPNSTMDLRDATGKVKQRREYGADGQVKKDIDTNDHGMPKHHPYGAHAHDWVNGKRSGDRPLTDDEKIKNKDILGGDD